MSRDAHPALPEFEYFKPSSLVEASQFLADHDGKARPLSGGTDIFVRMRDGVWMDDWLVDVKGLEGTDVLSFDPENGLTIGSAVNMNRVSSSAFVNDHYPLLAEACNSVAAYQLRSRATIVGNMCNASPAGDTIGASLLLDGELRIHGVDGFRKEPLRNFFKGPGKTDLKSGDIVTSIQFSLPKEGLVGKYIKHGRNNRGDLAIVGITAIGYPDGELETGVRVKVALASVAPIPLVVDQVEAFFMENNMGEESIKEGAQLAMDACSPIDDVRGSARYRKMMVRNLTQQALTAVWKKL